MTTQLYPPHTANAPRLATDTLFYDPENRFQYRGPVDAAARFIQQSQLLQPRLWRRFVQQFRQDADFDAGWRGEYWGKMMRGACFVWAYTRDRALYDILRTTVEDMLQSADADGRISSYGRDHEFDSWDLWCRKYVLLGLQYFLEICDNPALGARITDSMCRQLEYIMARIGPAEEGKKPITSATRNWRGLNASSLLEPVVRLYNITGCPRYLDFAGYIVGEGATDVEDLFTLAWQDELYPYQYPVTKAYEMISCFEGLLEYYRVTKEEKYRQAVLRFANKLLESDFTIIGSSGCTHELFDHSSVRQANTTNGPIAQETCVTVTLMKFFWQLTLLTGDSRYVDAFETALYNAYFGALNTEKAVEPDLAQEHPDWALEALPFDSYSPLTAGTRGRKIGGLQHMSDNHYYGCCACIGSAGSGLVPKMQLLQDREGLVVNLYIDGAVDTRTPGGQPLRLMTETAYPAEGVVTLRLGLAQPEDFALRLRIPAFSIDTALSLNGQPAAVTGGYTTLARRWQDGDTLTLTLDMRTRALRPTPYGHDILMTKVVWKHNYMVPVFDWEDPLAKRHIALLRGPLVLAQDARLCDPDRPVRVAVDADGTVQARRPAQDAAPFAHLLEMEVPLADGSFMRVTDYASAGKQWSSRMAAWMLTD